jgi:hypothetical protein
MTEYGGQETEGKEIEHDFAFEISKISFVVRASPFVIFGSQISEREQ